MFNIQILLVPCWHTQNFSMEHEIARGGFGSIHYDEIRGGVSSTFSPSQKKKFDPLLVCNMMFNEQYSRCTRA